MTTPWERSCPAGRRSRRPRLRWQRRGLISGFTKITSPIDGIAGIAKVGTGDLVGPGRTEELATVSKVDPIKAYVFLSEQEYLRLATQRKNGARNTNREIEMILADGTRISPSRATMSVAERQIDPKTGTIKVVLLFPNPGNILRPGQYAKIRAVLNTKHECPAGSAAGGHGAPGQVPGGGGECRQYREHPDGEGVGPRRRLWVIDEGLKPGERVVTEGTQKVKDKMAVRAVPFAGRAAGGTGEPPKPESGQNRPQGEKR